MAATAQELVREGVAALKAGRKDEAFRLLTRATELDERNEDAWLWLSAVVDSLENQQICLENVLAINPNNMRALKGLNSIKAELEKRRQQDQPAPVQPAAGFPEEAPPSSAPFILDDEPAIPVVEDSPVDDQLAYYGSGQAVDLPTADEYDDWVDNLNLGGDSSNEFLMAEDDLYVAPEPADDYGYGSTSNGRSGTTLDPFAIPQQSVDFTEDELFVAEDEPLDDLEVDDIDLAAFDGAAPFGAFDTDAESDEYKSEDRLIGYLEYLPPEIKPTHLPGQRRMYPLSLLISLGVLGAGVVAAGIGLVVLLLR
ncbi:MAG: hypothetical protein Kow0077_09880 [Anaerolineae bacterium]